MAHIFGSHEVLISQETADYIEEHEPLESELEGKNLDPGKTSETFVSPGSTLRPKIEIKNSAGAQNGNIDPLEGIGFKPRTGAKENPKVTTEIVHEPLGGDEIPQSGLPDTQPTRTETTPLGPKLEAGNILGGGKGVTQLSQLQIMSHVDHAHEPAGLEEIPQPGVKETGPIRTDTTPLGPKLEAGNILGGKRRYGFLFADI
ncbi:hypothetical protein K440DRAFT_641942 [Wilcoxina mikolae CBS 423.85]|nr:hypothetical protein K440DRAFT_641942 [Wilcoxina mikolae CBS 423.85]